MSAAPESPVHGILPVIRALHQAAAAAARRPKRSEVDYRAARDIQDLWGQIQAGEVIVEPADP